MRASTIPEDAQRAKALAGVPPERREHLAAAMAATASSLNRGEMIVRQIWRSSLRAGRDQAVPRTECGPPGHRVYSGAAA